MSQTECPMCGENAVVEDSHGLEDCRVCAECGYVVPGVTLTSEYHECVAEPIRGASKALTMALKRKASDPFCLMQCLQQIKALCRSMNFCEAMTEQTCDTFRELYENEKVHFRHMELKLAMAACCVYIVARMNSCPVTIGHIVRVSGISLVQFAKAYKLTKSCLQVPSVATPTIGQICAQVFASHNLPQTLLKQTQSLLLLCDKMWVTFSSSNKENMVIMCSYFAWQAHNIKRETKTDSATYCKKFNFSKQKIFQQRVFIQIRRLILAMGKSLPWLGEDLSLKMLPWYLEEILEYKQSLMKQAFGQFKGDESDEQNVTGVFSLRPRKKFRNDDQVLKETLEGEKQVDNFKKLHGSLDKPEITESEFAGEIDQFIK